MLTMKAYWIRLLLLGLFLILIIPYLKSLNDTYNMVIIWLTIGLSLVMSTVWTVYRLHDAGLPGSWIWLLVIPIVGNIGLILLLCIPSGTFDFFTRTYSVYYKRSQTLSN